MVLTTPIEMHAYSPQKMQIRPRMRAHATVQKSYCELILTLAQASYRLLFATRLLLSGRNQLCDAVRSRNPSKSTLAHDVVVAAVSHKHNSIICVGAGLIR